MTTNSATALSLPASPSPLFVNRKPLIAALLIWLAGAVYLVQTTSWRQGALWLVGGLMGVTLYHAAFGFTQAWRVFVSDRRGAGLRAQMIMLAFGVVLFFPFLAQGSLWGQHVTGLVAPAGVSVLLGAFMFGLGMQLGGGCASGTLFAVGAGNTRMLVTLLFFIIGGVLGSYTYGWWSHLPALPPVSLVKALGVTRALALNLIAFGLIAWLTLVLEKRRHGHVLATTTGTSRPASLLRGPWPLIAGGVGLVLLNFANLALVGHPWGITSAFALWGAKTLQSLGVDAASWQFWLPHKAALIAPISHDATSITDIGIMVGALAAASAAGKFDPLWRVPARSLAGAATGGLLLGLGSRMAYGCNIGAYFSGILSGSVHGWLWLLAAFIGSIAGVRLRPLFGLAVEKTPAPSHC